MSNVPPPLPSASKPKSHFIIIGSSLLIFLISLIPPAMSLDNGEVWHGAQVLIWGWLGIFIGCLAWLANPLLLVIYALLMFRRNLAVFIVSLLAVLIACLSFLLLGTQIPLDEGNVRQAEVLSLGPAFYLWLTAIATPGLGALVLQFSQKR